MALELVVLENKNWKKEEADIYGRKSPLQLLLRQAIYFHVVVEEWEKSRTVVVCSKYKRVHYCKFLRMSRGLMLLLAVVWWFVVVLFSTTNNTHIYSTPKNIRALHRKLFICTGLSASLILFFSSSPYSALTLPFHFILFSLNVFLLIFFPATIYLVVSAIVI